jgi:hypothetical protein
MTTFRAWLEIIELLLKCLAIVVAGIWAYTIFRLLKQREQAHAVLRKTEAEIRGLELQSQQTEASLEITSRKQAVVTVEIVASARPVIERGYIVLATVNLKNSGNRNTRIKWLGELPAFYVRAVSFNEHNKPEFGNAIELQPSLTVAPDQQPLSHVIRAGGTECIPFAFKVSSAGTYLLSFRGAVDEEERMLSAEAGARMPTAWTGSRYLVIEPHRPEMLPPNKQLKLPGGTEYGRVAIDHPPSSLPQSRSPCAL